MLKYSGEKFFNHTVSFGALQGPERCTSLVPTAQICFELIALGDGKMRINNLPRFGDLELANTDGSYTHPLHAAVAHEHRQPAVVGSSLVH